MKSIKATISDKKWTIAQAGPLHDMWGICLEDDSQILIGIDAVDRLELDTLIHEMIHASCPWMQEYHVAGMGTDISKALWAWGYRKQENHE